MTLTQLIQTAPLAVNQAIASGNATEASAALRDWAETLKPADGAEHRPERNQRDAAIEHAERLANGGTLGRPVIESAKKRIAEPASK